MDNKGGIDIQAWVNGILGFSVTYMAWIFTAPTLKELYSLSISPSMGLNENALKTIPLIQNANDYAFLLLGAGWLLYILYSSIRREVEENVRYY